MSKEKFYHKPLPSVLGHAHCVKWEHQCWLYITVSCHYSCITWSPVLKSSKEDCSYWNIHRAKFWLAGTHMHVKVSEDRVGLLGKFSALITALVYTGEQQSCVLQRRLKSVLNRILHSQCAQHICSSLCLDLEISTLLGFNPTLLTVTSETAAGQNILTLPLLHMWKHQFVCPETAQASTFNWIFYLSLCFWI